MAQMKRKQLAEEEFQITILEIARFAMETYASTIANHLDLSDEVMDELQTKIERRTTMDELTTAQIAQQDFVDNAISNMLNDIVTNSEFEHTEELEWDIQIISDVREVVQDILIERSICTEMQFYPYLHHHSFVDMDNEGEYGKQKCRICNHLQDK